jgi:hypothetical protein
MRAGHNGPEVDNDKSWALLVTCTAEFPAPGVGAMLTETCTSGIACAVRVFLVGG